MPPEEGADDLGNVLPAMVVRGSASAATGDN